MTHECEQCHVSYEHKRKTSRFCSMRCVSISNNTKRWSSIPRVCPVCAGPLVPQPGHRYRTYCSRSCASVANNAVRYADAAKKREARAAERVALRASIDAARRVRAEAAALKKPKNRCIVCESEVAGHGGRTTCSSTCRIHRQRQANKVQRKRRRALGIDDKGKGKKRAKRYGVAYERVDRNRVYERDGWRCQLCQEPINRSVKAPHPLSPSLDHIVPVSKGGPHTYANVQAAHFGCNNLKGSRMAVDAA